MKIGLPKEIKNNEFRVGLTPNAVSEYVQNGHTVLVEQGAGVGAGFTDEEYVAAGATIVPDAESAWAAEMVVKVKEPIECEYKYFRKGLVLYTYLHLAADAPLTKALMDAEKTFKMYVDNDTPPIADGAASTSNTLATMYPDSIDEAIGIGFYEKDLDNYFRLKDQLKNLTMTIDGIENRIKAHLGECARGEGEKYKVSWKTQSRSTFDSKKFIADHPEVDVSKYFKTSNSRPFRVTEKKGSN
jgi:hypothetical protein